MGKSQLHFKAVPGVPEASERLRKRYEACHILVWSIMKTFPIKGLIRKLCSAGQAWGPLWTEKGHCRARKGDSETGSSGDTGTGKFLRYCHNGVMS